MRGENCPLAQEHICSSCTRRRSSSIPMHNQTISCVSQFAFLLDSWSAGAICGEKRGGMNARSDQRSLGDLQPKRVWSCTSRTCSRVSVCSVAPGSRCGDVSMGRRCVLVWMICVIVVFGRLNIILPHVICIYSIVVCCWAGYFRSTWCNIWSLVVGMYVHVLKTYILKML
jgi:hypothetical protein